MKLADPIKSIIKDVFSNNNQNEQLAEQFITLFENVINDNYDIKDLSRFMEGIKIRKEQQLWT